MIIILYSIQTLYEKIERKLSMNRSRQQVDK